MRRSPLPEELQAPDVGIAGVGLIGGSIALRARELGWNAVGWDNDPAAIAEGRRRGALGAVAGSLRELADAVDVLVLAGPVDVTLGQLAELAELSGRSLSVRLVLDVGSVKAGVARAGRTLPAFVPTHPIAGSERSGVGAARADLFAGRMWAYEPAVRPDARDLALGFIAAMGSQAFAIDSGAHDELVALTSHLPQLLSVALGARLYARLPQPGTAALCGSGMRSMLRLAASSISMWRPVLAANAAPVAQEVRALVAILTEAAAALDRGDAGALADLFAAAAASVADLRENGAERGKSTDHETFIGGR